MCGEFPGGLLVKNPPCNVGDVDSTPGWETKIPICPGQLSWRATAKDSAGSNKDPCATTKNQSDQINK